MFNKSEFGGFVNMKIIVLGGTRFFGIHMVNALLDSRHDVTIATRGIASDIYGDKVKRVIFERTNAVSVKNAIGGIYYDIVIDKLAYCSNDINMLWMLLIVTNTSIC
jgi:nucleoside-diphosphate-sugar epimerase